MMDRDQAVALITHRLGRITSLATLAPAEIDIVQIQLEQAPQLYWFLQDDDASLVTASGNRDVIVPTGFLRETEDPNGFWYLPASGTPTPLGKIWYDLGVHDYGVDTGPPEKYALVGNKVKLFPIPDAAYSLQAFFFKKGDALVDGTSTNVWLSEAPDLLISSTVMKMATYSHDNNAFSTAQVERDAALARLWTAHEARENAGLIHRMRES